MNILTIDEYNEKFKDDYHNGVGSYGAQKIEIFKRQGVAIITIIVHSTAKPIMKDLKDMRGRHDEIQADTARKD